MLSNQSISRIIKTILVPGVVSKGYAIIAYTIGGETPRVFIYKNNVAHRILK